MKDTSTSPLNVYNLKYTAEITCEGLGKNLPKRREHLGPSKAYKTQIDQLLTLL